MGVPKVTEFGVESAAGFEFTPMNYNNRNQSRIATCNEHDNLFGVAPGGLPAVEKITSKAGLMPEYRDLLRIKVKD